MFALPVPDHPLLEIAAFVSEFPTPIGELTTTPVTSVIAALGSPGTLAPMVSDDSVRTAVRSLLRAGGFKPSGRSKPASEYLATAAAQGAFPVINAAVDACNVVSLHSGLPISLLDVERLAGGLAAASVIIAPVGTRYVFNPAGQEIDVGGLLCLADAEGPSGSPVKDAQRTKTSATTRITLSIVWGSRALPGRAVEAALWYKELVAGLGGQTTDVRVQH